MIRFISRTALLTLLSIITVNLTHAQTDSTKKIQDFEMRTYYFCMLEKGPNRSQDSVSAAKIQEAHLNRISELYKQGKICIAGPFLDDSDWRGIFIYSVDSLEEAQKLAANDPAVMAGRLVATIHPWMAARGSKLP